MNECSAVPEALRSIVRQHGALSQTDAAPNEGSQWIIKRDEGEEESRLRLREKIMEQNNNNTFCCETRATEASPETASLSFSLSSFSISFHLSISRNLPFSFSLARACLWSGCLVLAVSPRVPLVLQPELPTPLNVSSPPLLSLNGLLRASIPPRCALLKTCVHSRTRKCASANPCPLCGGMTMPWLSLLHSSWSSTSSH